MQANSTLPVSEWGLSHAAATVEMCSVSTSSPTTHYLIRTVEQWLAFLSYRVMKTAMINGGNQWVTGKLSRVYRRHDPPPTTFSILFYFFTIGVSKRCWMETRNRLWQSMNPKEEHFRSLCWIFSVRHFSETWGLRSLRVAAHRDVWFLKQQRCTDKTHF